MSYIGNSSNLPLEVWVNWYCFKRKLKFINEVYHFCLHCIWTCMCGEPKQVAQFFFSFYKLGVLSCVWKLETLSVADVHVAWAHGLDSVITTCLLCVCLPWSSLNWDHNRSTAIRAGQFKMDIDYWKVYFSIFFILVSVCFDTYWCRSSGALWMFDRWLLYLFPFCVFFAHQNLSVWTRTEIRRILRSDKIDALVFAFHIWAGVFVHCNFSCTNKSLKWHFCSNFLLKVSKYWSCGVVGLKWFWLLSFIHLKM